jgi:hypothetical protein
MLAFHVDLNAVDTSPTGGLAVGITLGHSNPPALRSLMEVGMRVIVYGDDIREEAILQGEIGAVVGWWSLSKGHYEISLQVSMNAF